MDSNYLYAIFKVSIACSLGDVMAEKGPFDETTTKFYVGSIASALYHLHSMDIIYRNIYPDSLLLTTDGYVQLMDMSYAMKVEAGERPRDYCGAAHYLSPEQVSGQGHDKAVDYWALGILMYEMMMDKNPWLTGDDAKDSELGIYARISDHTRISGTGLPQRCEDFLNDLLMPNPDQRLGMRGVGAEEIRAAPWMSSFDWYSLSNNALEAPHASMTSSPKLPEVSLKDEYTGDQRWCASLTTVKQ